MFKHYFELVDNVAIYPIISLTIFFLFFIGLGIHVMRMKTKHIEELEQLPLGDDDIQPSNPSMP
ncbi:MAG: CcoQ/FixQ family Cbb3-type cytochrome c oxidase assembly chaperone [Thermonemataceae bacterium]